MVPDLKKVWDSSEFHRRARRWRSPAIASVVLVALVIVSRWPILLSSSTVNPDEAELLAEGRRAALNLIPYQTYTTTTHTALWPTMFGILSHLGVPLTLPTAHVLSAIAYIWLVIAGWYIIARQLGWLVAGAFVLPTALGLFAAQGDGEFASLGTELLPVVLVMAAVAIFLAPDCAASRRRVALAAFLLGLSVWAKPQVLPLDIAVLAVIVVLPCIRTGQQTQQAATYTVAAYARVALVCFILPTLIFVTVMASMGTLERFVHEPMSFDFSYVGARSVASNGASPALDTRIQDAGSFVLGYPLAFIWALAGLIGWGIVPLRNGLRTQLLAGLMWLAPFMAAFITFLPTSPLYPHYANFLFAATMISGMIGSCISRRLGVTQADLRQRMMAVAPALCVVGFVVLTTWLPAVAAHSTVQRPRIEAAASQFHAVCPRGARVLVWGWSSEFYADFDWVPASRYVDNQWQLLASRGQAYYRATLAKELLASPPRCILQPYGRAFFAGDSFPPLTEVEPRLTDLVHKCYLEQPEDPAYQHVTVYTRRSDCRLGGGGP